MTIPHHDAEKASKVGRLYSIGRYVLVCAVFRGVRSTSSRCRTPFRQMPAMAHQAHIKTGGAKPGTANHADQCAEHDR
jgi:hypothetical protein